MELACGDNIIDHEAHIGNGQSKAQTLYRSFTGNTRIGHLQGIDADDLSIAVDKRPAGVAVIEGRRGLQHGEGSVLHLNIAVDGRDDALRQRAPQFNTQGVTNGVHIVAHHGQFTVAKLGGDEAVGILCLQHRDILLGTVAHQQGIESLPRIQRDPAAVASCDDMGVGDDVAIFTHNDARSHGSTVKLLRHHQHGGGVTFGIDLLDGQLLTLLPQYFYAGVGIIGVTGNVGAVVGENVHNAAGLAVLVPVLGGSIAYIPQHKGQHDHHNDQRHKA